VQESAEGKSINMGQSVAAGEKLGEVYRVKTKPGGRCSVNKFRGRLGMQGWVKGDPSKAGGVLPTGSISKARGW